MAIVICDMPLCPKHLSHQAPNLAMTDDSPEKAALVGQTEETSTLKAAGAEATATPTRTNRWVTLKTTTNSAVLPTKDVEGCRRLSPDAEARCRSIQTHRTSLIAVLR